MSGLRVNTDKTKLVWIGKKRYCQDNLDIGKKLTWGVTEFNLLGITFTVDLEKMIDLNYNRILNQVEKELSNWKRRYLTPIGKIAVLKTLILAKFNHVFISIPNPKMEQLKNLSTILYKFIWENKPDKINRKQLSRGYLQEGLKMMDLICFIKGLTISWIRRLFKSSSVPWVQLVPLFIGSVNNILFFGYKWSLLAAEKTENHFWKDVLLAWSNLTQNISENSCDYDRLLGPLWYNPLISDLTVISQLYHKGIISPIDIIGSNGNLMTKENIALNFSVNVDFLTYHRTTVSLKKYLKSQVPLGQNFQRPYCHNHIKVLCKSQKGSRDFYNILNTNKTITRGDRCSQKWEADLNIQIDLNTWKNIHKICFFSLKDNYFIWFQYKIIYRILGTKHYLHKIQTSNTSSCGLCQENEETLYHLFVSCKNSSSFWNDIKIWIKQTLRIELILNPSTKMFGNFELETPNVLVNVISMTAKYYIFQCSRKNTNLNICGYRNFLNRIYTEQKYLSEIDMHEETFAKAWSVFTIMFQD